MNNREREYPVSGSLIEDQMELRLRIAEAIIHGRLFSFTLSSPEKQVEGRLIRLATGVKGSSSLVLQVTLTDGVKANVYVPDLTSTDPVDVHFYSYGNPE